MPFRTDKLIPVLMPSIGLLTSKHDWVDRKPLSLREVPVVELSIGWLAGEESLVLSEVRN